MPLSEAEKWLDHLGSCSPCYSDFLGSKPHTEIDALERARHRREYIDCCRLSGWAVFLRQKEPVGTETAVLDLRNRSIARGQNQVPGAPLEIARTILTWRSIFR